MLISEIDIDGDLLSVGGKIGQHEFRPPEHADESPARDPPAGAAAGKMFTCEDMCGWTMW